MGDSVNNKMQTLHVISHTHWDREWYLTYQQFRLKLVHLVDRLLDILDADQEVFYSGMPCSRRHRSRFPSLLL